MSKLVCKKCVLDSDIPGININKETGLCHFCETYTPLSSQEKSEYLNKIDELFKNYSGKGKYDVIYALSGGKDSSYTLYKLKKEYPFLKVLAVQFDNGFTSENAIKNAKKMCEDHRLRLFPADNGKRNTVRYIPKSSRILRCISQVCQISSQ